MFTLTTNRMDGQDNIFKLIRSEEITEEKANQIDNYFTVNATQPNDCYQLTVTGPPGVKQYYSVMNDITGYLDATKKP